MKLGRILLLYACHNGMELDVEADLEEHWESWQQKVTKINKINKNGAYFNLFLLCGCGFVDFY